MDKTHLRGNINIVCQEVEGVRGGKAGEREREREEESKEVRGMKKSVCEGERERRQEVWERMRRRRRESE